MDEIIRSTEDISIKEETGELDRVTLKQMMQDEGKLTTLPYLRPPLSLSLVFTLSLCYQKLPALLSSDLQPLLL